MFPVYHSYGVIEKLGVLAAGTGVVGTAFADHLDIIVSLILVVGGVASAIVGARAKGSNQALRTTGQAWREERDAERAKADRLEQEKAEYQLRLQRAEDEVKELRGRTDVAAYADQAHKDHLEAMSAIGGLTEAVKFLATGLNAQTAAS